MTFQWGLDHIPPLRSNKEDRHRPILAKLNCAAARDNALQLAKHCRGIQFHPINKQVGIAPDRTPAERKEATDRYQEMRIRKLAKNLSTLTTEPQVTMAQADPPSVS